MYKINEHFYLFHFFALNLELDDIYVSTISKRVTASMFETVFSSANVIAIATVSVRLSVKLKSK